MRNKLPLLLVLSLLFTTVLLPRPALTQGRNIGVGSSQSGAGGYHALVIGINDYKSLPRLKTAEADARAMAALLKESYGFETRLLLNATRQQIVSALFSYRQTLGPEANLLVYYAGHGINDTQAEKAYWLPVDATRDDDSNWISADDITTRLRAIPARHVLVVSDSCYSGTLTRGLGEALPPANVAREQFLQRMMAGRSRTLMASGGDEPVADSGGGNHSVFAAALLRGLREMDKGRFTAAELFRNYVEERVAGRAEQLPEYNPLRNSGHESGDFVFVKIKTDGKTVEVTVKTPQPSSLPAAVDPAAIELSFWESIKASTDAEDFKAYLEAFPAGRFAALARNNLRRLEAAAKPAPSNPPAANTAANSTAARPSPARPTAGSTVRPRSGIELVYVPPGEFMMGSENGSADEKPVHRVTLREGFWMGKYEVTQAQWQAVMGTTVRQQRDKANPSWNMAGEGAENPMYYVNWNEAQEFIQKLNGQNDGFIYRLPTEAEWEYTARAGTTGDYAGNLDTMAWYGNNSGRQYLDAAEIWKTDLRNYGKRILDNGGQTHPVGQKQANAFGLYDMHGNVWEWCQDWYHDSYAGGPTDGSAWLSGGEQKYRVLRGGSWYHHAVNLRSANRGWVAPDDRDGGVGFRVVAVART